MAYVQVAAQPHPRLPWDPGRTIRWSGRPAPGEQFLDDERCLVVTRRDIDDGETRLLYMDFTDRLHIGHYV
ncbi:hypothetical protein GCM10010423_69840 [Streptomyces levis]|uniref:Uncharacterized protein n=1 Tax=Streptomyces levis TaxID=285566 RepID=A0ABP6BJB7_9ACTN